MSRREELAPRSRESWVRTAWWLVAGTMAYNVVEAGVAVASGVLAGSVALMGFGLDSVIECVAAGVVLRRIAMEARGGAAADVARSEGRVLRVVGGTFLLLALYVVVDAALIFMRREPPEESVVGIVLASASLLIMPLVSWGKLRAARALGSASLRAEAKETLACSYLSLTLLLGLAGNAAAGWWWADPLAALLMVPWLVREGLEAIRGEGKE